MPYFIDRTTHEVIVTGPNSPTPADADQIDNETVARCSHLLAHGMQLSGEQRQQLLAGQWTAFLGALGELHDSDEAYAAQLLLEQREAPGLPPAGTWEYRVLVLPTRFGLGTVKRRAARMETELNRLSADGWELVETTQATVTMRRFGVTDDQFMERFRAEERLRRAVVAELDAAD